MATAGQAIGGFQLPRLATAAVRWKLTTTFRNWDMLIEQRPELPPLPVPTASHPALAHALRRLLPEADAVSVTRWPLAKLAVHPAGAAVPLVMVHVIPSGVDVTVPLPSAPPEIVSAKLDGGGAKIAATLRDWSMETSHASGLSAASVQPVHPERIA